MAEKYSDKYWVGHGFGDHRDADRKPPMTPTETPMRHQPECEYPNGVCACETPSESVEAAIENELIALALTGIDQQYLSILREAFSHVATAARQERSMVAAKRGIANEKLRAKVQDQAAELELWKDRAALTKVDSHPVGEAQSTEKP